MNFSIDKQTLDELNILGKMRQGSVHSLFGRVQTRGGEQLLDQMFRHPLTVSTEINKRSSIFQFFQPLKLRFSFDVQQLQLMREYLDDANNKSVAATMVTVMIQKSLSVITRDERFKKKVQGLQASIVTVSHLHGFLQSIPDGAGPLQERIATIKSILSIAGVEKLRNTNIYGELPLNTLVYFEQLLKGKLNKEMQELLSFIHELDVYINVSDVARSRNFHYAVAHSPELNVFTATGLRHPCIEKAIGNNLEMHKGSNVVFLTGANMAGKSTLMKSIGIGMYLAHMGFPVAADSLDFSVREGLYSSINVADNIGLGYSHFYAEVVRVKQAAEAAASGKRLLLMFDELFKGTNVKDAFDGTLAVTEAFAEYRACLFIVSTHIIEVGAALKEKENIRFVYMPTEMEGNIPRYTYKLNKGVTEDRQGMMIIQNEGILEMLGS